MSTTEDHITTNPDGINFRAPTSPAEDEAHELVEGTVPPVDGISDEHGAEYNSPKRRNRLLLAAGVVSAAAIGVVGVVVSGGESGSSEVPSSEPAATAEPFNDSEVDTSSAEEISSDIEATSAPDETPESTETSAEAETINSELIDFDSIAYSDIGGNFVLLDEGYGLNSTDPTQILKSTQYYLNRGYSEGLKSFLSNLTYSGVPGSETASDVANFLSGRINAYDPAEGGEFNLSLETEEYELEQVDANTLSITVDGSFSATSFTGEQANYEGPLRFDYVKVEAGKLRVGSDTVEDGTTLQLLGDIQFID